MMIFLSLQRKYQLRTILKLQSENIAVKLIQKMQI